MTNKVVKKLPPSTKIFPVAAIGASAGGMEALIELLNNLPAETGIAYIYIQHLDPTHESNLVSILQRQTKMPVIEASDQLKIDPDTLYVIASNTEMHLVDGIIATSPRPSIPYANMPINRFFISLAERYKENAIGVILSGSATDGTAGLKAIKAEGGITIVQDESAKFQSMPKSAVAQGSVDLVLSPAQIAEELVKIGDQKDFYQSVIEDADEMSDADEDFRGILKLMTKSIGVDFTQYKMNTIRRRIIRRMMIHKLETLADYLQFIKQHTNEVNLLYQDLLINVTNFFRDPDASEYLLSHILPGIIKLKTPNDPIRIWIPACSTGQEAYSIAMLVIEALGDESVNTPVQIFATDLSENAINKARLGVYTKDEVAEVSFKRLGRFFVKTDGSYRIIKSIRDLCIFATHNVAKDPPFSRLDIISCSNLLIYLENPLQRKVIATFHYSLNNNGYLILGKSETVGTSGYLFKQVDKKLKIYAKEKEATPKVLFEMSFRQPEMERRMSAQRTYGVPKIKIEEPDLDREVDNTLLKKYTPASVVVTADLDIVQFRGSTGLYLEAAPGRASLNLMKMARAGMGFELRNIVYKAKKTGDPAKKDGIEINVEGKLHRIKVEAMPLKLDGDEEYFLVVFEEQVMPDADPDRGALKDKRVKQLEAELTALREDMRSIVEAQEAANEELQSANEEIVSSNEELQSINEELETSKEEIESSNEELITINQELQVRNEQLAEAQEYSEAIFATIRECILVLDKDMRVKTANNSFYKTFNLTDEEVEGRLLNEIGDRQWEIPELKSLLDDITNNNTQFRDFHVKAVFPQVGEKILLLNARRILQKIHGQQLILLAMSDITKYKQLE